MTPHLNTEAAVGWSSVVGGDGDEVEGCPRFELFLHENPARVSLDSEVVYGRRTMDLACEPVRFKTVSSRAYPAIVYIYMVSLVCDSSPGYDE